MVAMLTAVSLNGTLIARKMGELVAKVIGADVSNKTGSDKEIQAADRSGSPPAERRMSTIKGNALGENETTHAAVQRRCVRRKG